jgi:hypothetical protein
LTHQLWFSWQNYFGTCVARRSACWKNFAFRQIKLVVARSSTAYRRNKGFDTKAWFEELDRFNAEEPFMPEGREQPEPPEREFFN